MTICPPCLLWFTSLLSCYGFVSQQKQQNQGVGCGVGGISDNEVDKQISIWFSGTLETGVNIKTESTMYSSHREFTFYVTCVLEAYRHVKEVHLLYFSLQCNYLSLGIMKARSWHRLTYLSAPLQQLVRTFKKNWFHLPQSFFSRN